MTQTSWIAELRERLASPPPVGLATEGARQAALVPLFVDGGELWILLGRATTEELVPGAARLPLSPIRPGEEVWEVAQRCAPAVGADLAKLLRLGLLDSVPEPSGDVVIPCVAAVPAPPADDARAAAGADARVAATLVRLPLAAARAPSLLEERRAIVRGVETWVTVGHFGPVKLAGAEVEILELLLERLFRDGGL